MCPAQVLDSNPLEFGDGTKLGNRIEFLAPSLLVPSLPERIPLTEESNTLVCPSGTYSSFRMLPATRLISRSLPEYRLLVRPCSPSPPPPPLSLPQKIGKILPAALPRTSAAVALLGAITNNSVAPSA